jgi:hypothetical protein
MIKLIKIHHIIDVNFKCIVFHNYEENSLRLDYELSKKKLATRDYKIHSRRFFSYD